MPMEARLRALATRVDSTIATDDWLCEEAADACGAARRSLAALLVGIDELEAAWPQLDTPDGPLNDMVGYLFATAPLARRALATLSGEEES